MVTVSAERSIDNGIDISSGETNYALRTDLSSRIKRVNPNWNEPADDATFDVRLSFIGLHPIARVCPLANPVHRV